MIMTKSNFKKINYDVILVTQSPLRHRKTAPNQRRKNFLFCHAYFTLLVIFTTYLVQYNDILTLSLSYRKCWKLDFMLLVIFTTYSTMIF